jgi:hypothetical protein
MDCPVRAARKVSTYFDEGQVTFGGTETAGRDCLGRMCHIPLGDLQTPTIVLHKVGWGECVQYMKYN